MKDIENMLSRHTPKPKRSLPNNFTETVMSEIKSQPQPSNLRQWVPAFKTHLLSKVGIVSVTAIIIVSGTAAALALWPTPNVTPTITQQLPSGNHIVGYDAQNCNYFDELNGGLVTPTDDKVYYEVRQGSSVTDQQLQADLQALCENNQSNTEISSIIKQNHLTNLSGMMSTEDYVIRAISSHNLTVKLDSHYNTKDLTTLPIETYTHFASNLLVYDEGNRSTYDNLKIGDEITMIVQDTSGKSSETPQNYNPLNHPDTINILAIVKIPRLTGNPYAFDQLVGTEVVRAEKCNTSSTGFCRVYKFVN